jgi:hypothetical protein
MSWSYDATLSTAKDRVRLLLGDTDVSDPQFSNEELVALLTVHGSELRTAIVGARALSAKYSRQADKWVGDLKILASQKARAYRELAETLTKDGSSYYGVPSAGGISVSDKQTAESDTDRVAPGFTRDSFPYEGED